MTIFDYIIKERLLLSMTIVNGCLVVNCHAWDIQEIDELLQSFNGVREGFNTKIKLEDIYEKSNH